MTEQGIVTEITPEKCVVTVVRHTACETCSAKGGCFPENGRQLTAALPPQAGLKPGDSVTLEIRPRRLLFASFLAYIMPLLLMVAAVALAGAFFEKTTDLMRAIAGFAGLAAGFGLLRAAGGFLEKRKFLEIRISGRR